MENTFKPQISTLENTVKAIDERVGKNQKRLATLENERIDSVEDTIKTIN